MLLSDLQIKTLKRYWKFHSENYHSSDLIIAYAASWIFCIVGMGVSYWLTTVEDRNGRLFMGWLGWCGIGFFFANIFMTIKIIRVFGKLWGMLDSIVNWERVEALIKENEPVQK